MLKSPTYSIVENNPCPLPKSTLTTAYSLNRFRIYSRDLEESNDPLLIRKILTECIEALFLPLNASQGDQFHLTPLIFKHLTHEDIQIRELSAAVLHILSSNPNGRSSIALHFNATLTKKALSDPSPLIRHWISHMLLNMSDNSLFFRKLFDFDISQILFDKIVSFPPSFDEATPLSIKDYLYSNNFFSFSIKEEQTEQVTRNTEAVDTENIMGTRIIQMRLLAKLVQSSDKDLYYSTVLEAEKYVTTLMTIQDKLDQGNTKSLQEYLECTLDAFAQIATNRDNKKRLTEAGVIEAIERLLLSNKADDRCQTAAWKLFSGILIYEEAKIRSSTPSILDKLCKETETSSENVERLIHLIQSITFISEYPKGRWYLRERIAKKIKGYSVSDNELIKACGKTCYSQLVWEP